MSYIKRKSKKQEERVARDLGGRTQIASGAIEGMKGDVRTGNRTVGFNSEDFLIENKFTDSTFYTLKVDTFKKIEEEAFRDNLRTPVLQVDVQELELVVLTLSDFNLLKGDKDFDCTEEISTKAKSFRLHKDTFSLQPYEYKTLTFTNLKPVIKLAVINYSDFTAFQQ